MKKTWIAAAVLAATASGAFAQSSVTLYGRLNVTLENQEANDNDDNGVHSNSSYIGFRGVEDLGGGLKAGFNLQHGLSVDTGTQTSSTFWNRESELYLQGNWGTVRLGRWTPETYLATADYISMHNHDAGSSADAFYMDAYASNRVGYRTPKFGKFQAEVAVAEGSSFAERTTYVSGAYQGDSLYVGLGYTEQGDFDQVTLAAAYDFGNLTLGGYVQQVSEMTKVQQVQVAPNVYVGDRTSYRLSAMYRFGANELHANVGVADNIGDIENTSAHQYTIGINHNLSKRTKVYAFYTAIGDDEILRAYTPGDFRSVALGVRHNF